MKTEDQLIWESYSPQAIIQNMGARKLSKYAKDFFKGKEKYLENVNNHGELLTRLTWLSEGSLNPHLINNFDDFKHGGDPKEKKMFEDFIKFIKYKENG